MQLCYKPKDKDIYPGEKGHKINLYGNEKD